jgi:hypothetical protein
MDAFCPTRKEKIQEVKDKVTHKLYDTNELKQKTVNKLVQSEDLRKVVSDFSLAKRQKVQPHSDSSPTGKESSKTDLCMRKEKVKEAKEKSQKGYYNNPKVFSKVAQRLIDSLGI